MKHICMLILLASYAGGIWSTMIDVSLLPIPYAVGAVVSIVLYSPMGSGSWDRIGWMIAWPILSSARCLEHMTYGR